MEIRQLHHQRNARTQPGKRRPGQNGKAVEEGGGDDTDEAEYLEVGGWKLEV